MKVCLVEDDGFRDLYPLTKTRPVFGLRCGEFTLEERILEFFPQEIEQLNYLVRPEIEPLWEVKSPAQEVSFDLPTDGDRILLNGRILFDEQIFESIFSQLTLGVPCVWFCEDTWAAIYLPDGVPDIERNELFGNLDLSPFSIQRYLDVPVITYPWDLIHRNSAMIRKDFASIIRRLTRLQYPPLPTQVSIQNPDQLLIGQNTEIYPFVSLDCSRGPIIIGDNVTIESGAFIQGPVSIGDNCLISANTKIYRSTSVGETCKLGGEISHSILHRFSNKRHSGYLGNSYIGEWVNLGAGTNNSNMKNNYNKISVTRNGKEIDTGSQFIGLFMGDHSRTAIGIQFNTATFVGVGCNIFGSSVPPQEIDDFAWGGIEEFDLYDFSKFVENARRMMIRREKELSKEEVSLLKALHERRSIIGKENGIKSNGMPQ